MTTRVFLGGEGRTELGRWASEPAHRATDESRGLLESLAVRGRDAEVVGATPWKGIRKYRPGGFASAEERNVLGLALAAKEQRAVLVFLRDRDRDVQRERDVERGLERARELFQDLPIAGGCAVEAVEAFGLWALKDARAETYGDPKAVLRAQGHDGRAALCDLVEVEGAFGGVPAESASGRWLARLEAALGTATPPKRTA